MIEYSEIKTGIRESCMVCGAKGTLLYSQIKDQLFSAPGKWNLNTCPECSLVWLNPYPLPEEVGKLYDLYYTHQNIKKSFFSVFVDLLKLDVYRSVGYKFNNNTRIFIGRFIPYFKEYVGLSILNVKSKWGSRLLDVGSGNGEYLDKMRSFGWEVEGVETDPKAADFACKKYNLKIHIGNLSDCKIPSESFDVITMNHVIEHVYDPEKLLLECKRILKPGGRLVILTPNTESLGNKVFKKNWRGLEVPRHMVIFSVSNLGLLVSKSGFKIEALTSTARIARYLYSSSVHIKQGKQGIGGGGNRGYWLAFKSYGFQTIEELIRIFNRKVGEEIIFVGLK